EPRRTPPRLGLRVPRRPRRRCARRLRAVGVRSLAGRSRDRMGWRTVHDRRRSGLPAQGEYQWWSSVRTRGSELRYRRAAALGETPDDVRQLPPHRLPLGWLSRLGPNPPARRGRTVGALSGRPGRDRGRAPPDL
ncbi:MAG: hypothetical protein AVDCRST_MAG87-3572, partial [uncultured Thermomicrobiales bacterium]